MNLAKSTSNLLVRIKQAILPVVVFWYFVSFFSLASPQSVRYSEINLKDGLSQATVLDMVQDRQGFMWFATQDGLNRYDGHDFVIYRANPDDSNSISSNYVNNVFEDSAGFIWSTTRKGLNKYDPTLNQFQRFFTDNQDPYSIASDWTFGINEDHLGHIWIGSYEDGLSVYNPNTHRFMHYRHDPNDSTSLSSNGIYDIFVDRTGVIWIATRDGGVSRFNKEKNNFTQFKHNAKDPNSISSNRIYRIFQHSDGSLWFASRGKGLNRFDPKNQRFIRYQHDPNDINSISENNVWSIVEDQNGDLLVGTFTKGLNRLIHNSKTFIRISYDPSAKFGLSSNSVISSYADRNGSIWFGVRDVGLNLLNQQTAAFNHYRHRASDSSSLSDNSIQDFLETRDGKILVATREGGINVFNKTTGDFRPFKTPEHPLANILSKPVNQLLETQDGSLWIAYKNDGLVKYNQRTGEFVNYRYDANDASTLSDNFITSMAMGMNNQLWLGSRNGLNRLDIDTGVVKRYYNDDANPNSLSSNWITHLLLDSRRRLWVSTEHGLSLYQTDVDSFIQFSHNASDDSSIASDSLFSGYEDKRRQIWFATNNGLSLFQEKTQTFRNINKSEGLSNNMVYGIAEDDNGMLWIITNYGLNRYDYEIGQFTLFTEHDGLQGNEFNINAIVSLSDGDIMIGGLNGFNIFDPNKIKTNVKIPQPVITNFRIANSVVNVGTFTHGLEEEVILTKSINYTDEIILNHEESVFSFEFTSFNYYDADSIKYDYRLEGFDLDWNKTDQGNRRATYTNLAAGKYVFMVKAHDKHSGASSQVTSIALEIKPQWWETPVAKFLWLVTFFLSALKIYRYKSNQIQKQKTDLQLQVSRQVAQVVQQKRALETSYNDIKVLSGIGQKINASLDLEKVLWAVYEDINKLMDGTIFGIGLLQEDDERIKIKLAMEKGTRYKPYYRSMKNKEQFPVWCIDHDEVVFVNDLELDGRRYLQHHEYDQPDVNQFTDLEGAPAGDIAFSKTPQSFVYVPMRSSDKVLGFLSVQSFHKHAYQDVHVDILKTLAAYTGTAIVNAKEHQELLDSRQELIESEKMASLGALTAGVAHEINNPTNFVHVSAQNLEAGLGQFEEYLAALAADADDDVKEGIKEQISPLYNHISTIKEGTNRIKTIIHDLRSFTHLDAVHKKEVSICENLLSTIHLVETQFSDVADFVTQFNDDPQLICYPSQLNQVYMNLMVNACDAIRERIEQQKTEGVREDLIERGIIVVSCRSLISEVEITIKDNRAGMSEATKKRLFEPFYTTKKVGKGSGLGLSISYGIVKKHDGSLTVETQKNQGTTFKLTLPFSPSHTSSSDESISFERKDVLYD